MQYACTQSRKIQHLIISYLRQLARLLYHTGIGGIYAIHIGIYLTGISLKRCSQRYCRGIGTTAAQRGIIAILVDTLETGNDNDLLLIQLMTDTLGIDPL